VRGLTLAVAALTTSENMGSREPPRRGWEGQRREARTAKGWGGQQRVGRTAKGGYRARVPELGRDRAGQGVLRRIAKAPGTAD
jgi:hypothetical protein